MRALPASTVVLLLGGCSRITVLNPKGQIGMDEKSLIITAAAVMLIVVVPVIVMAFTFAWRYRASNTKARYAPEWGSSRRVEVVIWAVPLIIVAALSILAWRTSHSLDPFRPIAARADPVDIEVVSLDWKWLFIYPKLGIATVNEIAFPTGVPVDFTLTSDTVMNSFFIPQLGSQIYTMAGMATQLHLIADHPGTYDGISANFSGSGFSGMSFKAIAAGSRSQFDDWVRLARQSPKKLDLAAYRALARPSQDNPVEYFSSVEPDIFGEILREYNAPQAAGHQE